MLGPTAVWIGIDGRRDGRLLSHLDQLGGRCRYLFDRGDCRSHLLFWPRGTTDESLCVEVRGDWEIGSPDSYREEDWAYIYEEHIVE